MLPLASTVSQKFTIPLHSQLFHSQQLNSQPFHQQTGEYVSNSFAPMKTRSQSQAQAAGRGNSILEFKNDSIKHTRSSSQAQRRDKQTF